MKEALHYKYLNKERIREAYKSLKKQRIVLTMGEFSEKIGYGRTYISRVLNDHEPLTEEVKKRVAKLMNETNNVPPKSALPKIGSSEYLDAVALVLMQRISFLLAEKTGRSVVVERELMQKDVQDLLKIGGGA